MLVVRLTKEDPARCPGAGHPEGRAVVRGAVRTPRKEAVLSVSPPPSSDGPRGMQDTGRGSASHPGACLLGTLRMVTPKQH